MKAERLHRPVARLRAAVAAAMVAIACVGGCGGNPNIVRSLDPNTLPPDVRHAFHVFEVHCSKCHTLARPLNAQIDDRTHWDRYVARMRRMPSSGISPRDAKIILEFLYWWTGGKGGPAERRHNASENGFETGRER